MTSPIRVLRQIIAPNGKHRPRRPVLLPDEPCTLTVGMRGIRDEGELEQLLDSGDAVANESANCPECKRNTFHAMNRDGSRRCWTCGSVTAGDGE
jgi:ribosomal protein L37AE/L43A